MQLTDVKKYRWFKITGMLLLINLASNTSMAQTDIDAIMMNKTQFCSGFIYNHSAWDHYWEGTLHRTNENLGTITTQSVMYMANYGITDNLNIMAGAPYVWTKASAGTLHGMEGVQDLSVYVKWRAYQKKFGKNQKLSLFLIGGISTPLSDYVIDFLPMSIGLGSTNGIARGMVDYQIGKFTITGSAAFISRSNVHLDRTSYYDTVLHLTSEIDMPNAMHYQFRTGYRGKYLLAEALLTNFTTLGGFDITRNNMPFPSNEMNSTTIGATFKYTMPFHVNLSATAGTAYTVAGRNSGQNLSFNFGVFYAFHFNKNASPNANKK